MRLKFIFILMSAFILSGCESGDSSGNNSLLEEDENGVPLSCLEDANAPCPGAKKESIRKTFGAVPTDILFVLDESCSMSTIANNMKLGFESLESGQYPANTLMGVTYMSPVMQSGNGELDFSTPYHNKVDTLLPGHMKLVNETHIADYVAAYPEYAGDFSKEACSNSWFEPTETNASGDSCLSAAVQLAPICTGIEAGVVSLLQMLEKYNQEGERLFRPGANVSIILVSDTHEPGAGYWGRNGAPERMANFEEIIYAVSRNSRGISSLKVGGILPVPKKGHPELEGLKVIGDIPQTDAEAKINGEGFWDYSYLPLIKTFQGAVSHAKSSDWTAMAESLVEDAKTTGTILLEPKSKAKKVLKITVNGEVVDPSTYFIAFGGEVISLRYSSPTDVDLDIQIFYEESLD